MKPAPFEYHVPRFDSNKHWSLMSQHTDEAKILAGGQSLVPAMNFRIVQPDVLIDLNQAADVELYSRRWECNSQSVP